MRKIIFFLFATLIFFVPIVLWPYTSEVFEFNKVVLVYILTAVITAFWLSRCIAERRIIFRRTILDIPLLIFFASQLISTLLSIDFYTSVFGYYSRFNGGLLSTICYLLLYWAFVSNFDGKDALRLIKVWFTSAVIVSVYGIMEHFGIDKSIWVQDVQSRVFSSLGQPNWLAAWLVALIPISWAFALKSKVKSFSFWLYLGLSVLFFWTLIFTKSRSGFFGFGIATLLFWGAAAWQNIKKLPALISPLLVIGLTFVAICLISGTQWTPSLNSLINHSTIQLSNQQPQGPALETGGTESGAIRKIVWSGAIQLWQHYPVFGTGVETFAYSYYLYRPVAHNLTSEWDFIYNKAHNEFLNMAANSGTFGIFSYLLLIGTIIYIFIKKFKFKNSQIENSLEIGNWKLEITGLLAGFISLSASNFFGFSVVPTQLQFFLFPAIAVALTKNEEERSKNAESINSTQKTLIAGVLLFSFYLLFLTSCYWYADILYNRGKALNAVPRPDLAVPVLSQAVSLEPSQAIYYGELASSYTQMALAYNQAKDATDTAQFTTKATDAIQNAINIAPANINLRRTEFGIYARLSGIDGKYLAIARDSLNETIKLAPTDAKLYYNLGLADENLQQIQAALSDFQKAIELKADYANARVEYASLLASLGRKEEARSQLIYVIDKIDPNNQTAKQLLVNIK